MSNFDICLYWIIFRECGWRQTIGQPFIRTRDRCYWDGAELVPINGGNPRTLPNKPDGMAFDDDPNDTGGRTCMGILQRVYDGYRVGVGLEKRDVWTIDDDEIRNIYFAQYWLPMRLDELPLPLALKAFDMGVNAGIGTGARCLQRALGVNVDGHIGSATIGAAREQFTADAAGLLKKMHAERLAYYRQCRTWSHHGEGWTRRNDATLAEAVRLTNAAPPALPGAARPSPVPVTDVEPPPVAKPGARAEPETKSSMSQSTSGHVAIGTGTGGAATTAQGVARAVKDTPADAPTWHILLNVMAEPLFWVGVVTLAGAVYVWIERRRIMRMMGV